MPWVSLRPIPMLSSSSSLGTISTFLSYQLECRALSAQALEKRTANPEIPLANLLPDYPLPRQVNDCNTELILLQHQHYHSHSTGSSDLIVNSPNTSFHESGKCIYGTYNMNSSSTVELLSQVMVQSTPVTFLICEAQGD